MDPYPQGTFEDGGRTRDSVGSGQSTREGVRRRAFLGPDASLFGDAKTGEYVRSIRSAWETLLLSRTTSNLRNVRGKRRVERGLLEDRLHWHDLRHEALSRLADDNVPVHELQMLAGHANITTTQRYMNARANALAESMRHARERRKERLARPAEDQMQVG